MDILDDMGVSKLSAKVKEIQTLSVKLRKEQQHRSRSFCMIHALYYNKSVRITEQF